MRLLSFITEGTQIEKILDHVALDWDLAAQPEPDFEVNQRVNWGMRKNGDSDSLRVALRQANFSRQT